MAVGFGDSTSSASGSNPSNAAPSSVPTAYDTSHGMARVRNSLCTKRMTEERSNPPTLPSADSARAVSQRSTLESYGVRPGSDHRKICAGRLQFLQWSDPGLTPQVGLVSVRYESFARTNDVGARPCQPDLDRVPSTVFRGR